MVIIDNDHVIYLSIFFVDKWLLCSKKNQSIQFNPKKNIDRKREKSFNSILIFLILGGINETNNSFARFKLFRFVKSDKSNSDLFPLKPSVMTFDNTGQTKKTYVQHCDWYMKVKNENQRFDSLNIFSPLNFKIFFKIFLFFSRTWRKWRKNN